MEYLHHQIAWGIVQRMLIDAPSVEQDEGANNKELTLSDENAQEVLEIINNMNR